MSLTHPNERRSTLGDVAKAEGLRPVGEAVRRVVGDLADGVHSRPATFWLVWSKGSPRNPRFTHQTQEAAQAEARRLARNHPDRRWFVVQAVERLWVNEAADHLETQDAPA